MSYTDIGHLIEEILLKSLGEYIENLPHTERHIISQFMDGQTPEKISREMGYPFSKTRVEKTIEKIKTQLTLEYSNHTARRV